MWVNKLKLGRIVHCAAACIPSRRAALLVAAMLAVDCAFGATTNTVTTALELESAFASANNTVILLMPGTYELSSMLCRTNVTVSLVGVAADGVTPAAHGDVVVTVADGDNDGAGDFSIMLVEGVSGTSFVTLRHITFRGGNSDVQGGALRSNKNARFLIEDCVFDGNRAATSGGAISAWGKIDIADSVFSGNVSDSASGGALYIRTDGNTTGTNTIERCVFTNNLCVSYGGAVCFGDPNAACKRTLEMRNCLFSNNRLTSSSSSTHGGALYVKTDTSITGVVENCTFVGNSTGVYYSNANSYSRGGAIYESAPVAVSNCVFYVNRSVMDNSRVSSKKLVRPWKYASIGVLQTDSFALVGNCLFCNDPDYPAFDYASDFSTSYDGVTPVSDGVNGNKVGAYSPGFANAADGDYTLAENSVCRNAGANAAWMEDAVDLIGKKRICEDVVDIGCYEFFMSNSGMMIFVR